MQDARWSPFIKQLAIVAAALAAVWLVLRVHLLLTPLVLALLLAFLVSYPARWLIHHTGWPRWAVVGVIYLIVLVLIVTAPVILVPRVAAIFASFGTTLANALSALSTSTPQVLQITPSLSLDLTDLLRSLDRWLDGTLQPSLSGVSSLQSFLFPFASGAAVVVRGAVSSLLWMIFILAVSFYITKDAPMMGRFLASRVPEPFRPEIRRLWRELALTWDAFVRGQLLLHLCMGLLVWAVCAALGLRNAGALGLTAAILEFVPGIGPVIATIPALLIALILGSSWIPLPHTWFAVLVGLAYFMMSEVENIILLPHLVGRRIALHPVVVIVGALAGAQLAGALGIFLAAPSIASLRLIIGYVIDKILDREPFPEPAPPPDPGVAWAALVAGREVQGILFDLDGTLAAPDCTAGARLAERLGFLQRWPLRVPADRPAAALLLLADQWANTLTALLHHLRLRGLLARIDPWLHRWRGQPETEAMTAGEGTLAALRQLAQRYPLALLTARSAREADVFLANNGLEGLFSTVLTRDDSRHVPPHPVAVQLAVRRLGLKPENCVLVGDTPAELAAARSAGVLVAGVLSGLGNAADLASADLVIDSVACLGAWLPRRTATPFIESVSRAA